MVIAMVMVIMAAARPVEGVGGLHPCAGCEPGHALVVAALDLARGRGLLCLVPVLDTIVHPAVQSPEQRVDVRGVEFSEKVVAWIIPLLIEIVGLAHGNGTRPRIVG
ncbi:MAG: hypothetical protein ACRDTA_13215 [Pseudonocardiaceae bacterium]